MKKGLLLTLLGIALVAVLALPQTASAATLWPNTAQINGFTTPSGPVTITISALAWVNVISSASLAMTKEVENWNTGEGPLSIVDALSGHVIVYTVTITNLGEDDVLSIAFTDLIPLGLTYCDGASAIPGCQDPTVLPPGSGSLDAAGAPVIVDLPGDPLTIPGLGSITLTYTAQVN